MFTATVNGSARVACQAGAVAQCGPQHEHGERGDQRAVLGERDELVRADGAVLGVRPARQCLDSLDAARGQVDLRLVEHGERVGRDGVSAGRPAARAATASWRSSSGRYTSTPVR